jgi:hypothetical protein
MDRVRGRKGSGRGAVVRLSRVPRHGDGCRRVGTRHKVGLREDMREVGRRSSSETCEGVKW